ncbi:hypothetical protein ACVWXL_000733 [Bradyrhizobium sp. GM22.5]
MSLATETNLESAPAVRNNRAQNWIELAPVRSPTTVTSRDRFSISCHRDFQQQLCKMPTHATMNPKAKREMLPYIFPIDDEAVGASNNLVVSVARDVPHHNFIASPDLLVPYREIVHSGPAHMRARRLVSYNLGYRPGH